MPAYAGSSKNLKDLQVIVIIIKLDFFPKIKEGEIGNLKDLKAT